MVTEAALIAIIASVEKLFDGTEKKPFEDLRDRIEQNIAAFNHPDVQQAVPWAIDELTRLIALSKENITKL
jgi:hypothetical protein